TARHNDFVDTHRDDGGSTPLVHYARAVVVAVLPRSWCRPLRAFACCCSVQSQVMRATRPRVPRAFSFTHHETSATAAHGPYRVSKCSREMRSRATSAPAAAAASLAASHAAPLAASHAASLAASCTAAHAVASHAAALAAS